MFDSMAQAITGFLVHNNNPLGLTLLGISALVEYVFPPFPGDTVTLFGAFLVARFQWSLPLVFSVVLLGSAVGAMVNFSIGVWLGGRYREGRFLRGPRARQSVEKILSAFQRHGEVYIVFNRFLPALRAVFFFAAGMAGLRPLRVLFFAAISAAVWNGLILGAGYAVGANWERIQALFKVYSLVAWAVIGAAGLFFLARWLLRRRTRR
jgi:membrane protein DedA with SNARE-associated domain